MARLNRERLLIGIALLCLGAFAADHFILSPMIEGWKARSAKIAVLNEQIEKGTMLLDREGTLEARWREMKALSLPANEGAAENQVLSALGDWARQGQMTITDLKPRWIREKNKPKRLEIRLSATGKLPALRTFMYELERAPMSLRVEQVEVRSRDTKGTDLALEARFSGLVLAEEKL